MALGQAQRERKQVKIEPEQRLLLSALLLVVAEQDQNYVKIKHRKSARDTRARKFLAEEARLFVASEEFNVMCEAAGIDSDGLRAKTPAEAYKAYLKIAANEEF